MRYDLDEPRAAIEFPSAAYDNWKTTEPDDCDDVYYGTWAEAEEAAARTTAWAKKLLAEQAT